MMSPSCNSNTARAAARLRSLSWKTGGGPTPEMTFSSNSRRTSSHNAMMHPFSTFGIRRDAAQQGAGRKPSGTEQSGSRPLRSLVHCWGMAPMRNFLVPQTTQVAWAAARPFFMVTAFRVGGLRFGLALDAVDQVGVAGGGHGAFLLRA